MGNLCASCFGLRKREDESAENERLLQDPTQVPEDRTSLTGDQSYLSPYSGPGGTNGAAAGGGGGDVRDYGTMNGNNKSQQETSSWNRTLEKMAADVIDVSTITTSTIEQSEWQDRSRMYANRVANSRVGSILKNMNVPKPLPKNELREAITQAFEPMHEEDLSLINHFSEAALNAVRQGFVIRSNEQIIVQFDP
jgi:hypothetical protein